MKKTIGKVLSLLIVMSMLLSTTAFMAFAVETYDTLVVDGVGTVSLTEDIPSVILEFTPTKTGYYVISSDNGGDEENIDPVVYILDSEFNTIADDDDGGKYRNFICRFTAEAGETYYVEFTNYYESSVEYDYYVNFVETPESISVEVSGVLQENRDGYYSTDSLHDENGEYIGESEEYFYYDFDELLLFTITYADGSAITGTYDEIGESTGIYPEILSGQSYDNAWGPGVHTVECLYNYAGEEYISCEFEIEVIANPVSSLSAVGTIDLIEGYSGNWTNGYNEETGEYDLKYYEYSPWSAYLIYTIVYNGETYTGDESYICDIVGGDVWVSYSSDQSYDNQWGAGTHEFTIYFAGAKGTATVEIVENPVESIEVVVKDALIENYDGYLGVDKYWDEELQDWVYSEEYYKYNIEGYSLYNFTIAYKDGTVYTGNRWDIEDETGIYIEIDSDQSYDNQWGVGAHEVEITFLGKTATVTVNIIENPVASVTATHKGSYIEGIDGFSTSDSIYDEDDNYIGETDDYFYYYIDDEDFTYKVTYKDGTVYEGSNSDILRATGYDIGIEAQQSYENQLKPGNNTVEVHFLGVVGNVQVKIVESPLDYVIFDNVTLIENADGYWDNGSYWDEDLGEWVDGDEYFCYYFRPSYTAVMKDGTKLTSDSDGDIFYNGGWYSIYYYLDQSYDNQLGVGKHTVEGQLLGKKVTFNINIVETPVKSVKLTPTRDVIFGIDGADYYNYVEFNVEIEFKDGTKDKCLERDLYQKYGYVLQMDDAEFISDYVSEGTFWFMGCQGDFQVTFIDNPYESITISGLNELKISFNKPNGTSDVATVIGYYSNKGGQGYVEGGILTDKGIYEASVTYAYDDEDEYPTQDITLTIGEMTSNTLENHNWLWAYNISIDYLYDVNLYRDYCKYFYGREFTGLDITASNYNVTDLAAFALSNFGSEYDYDYVYGEECSYAVFNADDVVEMIERMFNITNVDITEHIDYNSEDNTIKIALPNRGGYYSDIWGDAVNYINGKWYFTRTVLSTTSGANENIEIVLNDDLLIEKISIGSKKLSGWILEAGKWAYYENGVKVTNRWMADSQGWCYLGGNGYCVTNDWVADSHGWCYLDANGRMVYSKWIQDDGKWYYIDSNGYMVSNTWKKDSIGWCYLGSSGAMLTESWVRDSVGWCYVGANGYCVTNCWKADSKGWCYLDANGRMATNKWIKDSVGWCYVGANGYCVTNNWVKDSKGWCYMDENGRMTISKWIQDGGKWYYLDENGYMVTGTKKIGGKTYKFASNGVWLG